MKRVYCSLELARKIMKFMDKNKLGDYFVHASDKPQFKRYVLVRQDVATIIVGEFAGESMATEKDYTNKR